MLLEICQMAGSVSKEASSLMTCSTRLIAKARWIQGTSTLKSSRSLWRQRSRSFHSTSPTSFGSLRPAVRASRQSAMAEQVQPDGCWHGRARKKQTGLRGFEDPDVLSLQKAAPTGSRLSKSFLLTWLDGLDGSCYVVMYEQDLFLGRTSPANWASSCHMIALPCLGSKHLALCALKSAYGLSDAPLLWYEDANRCRTMDGDDIHLTNAATCWLMEMMQIRWLHDPAHGQCPDWRRSLQHRVQWGRRLWTSKKTSTSASGISSPRPAPSSIVVALSSWRTELVRHHRRSICSEHEKREPHDWLWEVKG